MHRDCSEAEKLTQRKRHSKKVETGTHVAVENLFCVSIPSSDSTSTPSDKSILICPNPSEDNSRTPEGGKTWAFERPASKTRRNPPLDLCTKHTPCCSGERVADSIPLHIWHKRVVQFLVPLEHSVIVDLRQRDTVDFFGVPPHSLLFLLQIPSSGRPNHLEDAWAIVQSRRERYIRFPEGSHVPRR